MRAACLGTPAGQRGSSTPPREWTRRRTRSLSGSPRSAACVRTRCWCMAPLDASQRQRLAAAGGGVIWCPTSNLRLFGRTAALRDLDRGRPRGPRQRLAPHRRLRPAAGLGAARQALSLDEATLERLVTSDSARLLRLKDCGTLTPGAHADLIVLPAAMPLSQARRADLRLVMRGGAVRYGIRTMCARSPPPRTSPPLRCMAR